VRLGKWELVLDPKDGSIRFLREAGSRLLLADPRHRLAVYAYQTFSPGDMDRFYRQYCRLDIWWAQKDLNKPGLPSGARSGWHVPRVVGFECKSNGGELTVELRFSPESRRFGAPEQSVAVISPHDQGLDVQLQWFGKPANRMPESFWLQFNPRIARNASMTLTKLGLAVDPQDVVSKGNRHLHGANGPVRIGNLSIHSLDTVLVSPGKPRLLDFSQRQPDKHSGVFYNLFNNAWGTNFPQWYSDDALFRFKLRWSPDAAIASMTGSKA